MHPDPATYPHEQNRSQPVSPHDRRPVLLAIDAATQSASIALLRGEESLAEASGPAGGKTDGWILDAVESVLATAGLRLSHLDGLAVTVGPGTFTGIRVGIATAMGLAAGGGLAVAGVGTLAALAESARATGGALGPALPCLDARRQQVYCALYRIEHPPDLGSRPEWGPLAISPAALCQRLDEISPAPVILGSGADRYEQLSGHSAAAWIGARPPAAVPSIALSAGRLAARTWRSLGTDAFPPPVPVYLRPPDARIGRNPLRSA